LIARSKTQVQSANLGTLRDLQDQFRQFKTQVQKDVMGLNKVRTWGTQLKQSIQRRRLFNQGLHGLAENFGVAIDVGGGGGGGH